MGAEIEAALVALRVDSSVAGYILEKVSPETHTAGIINPAEVTVAPISPKIPLVCHHSELVTLPDPVVLHQLHVTVVLLVFLYLVLLDIVVVDDYVRD